MAWLNIQVAECKYNVDMLKYICTVLPAKSDSDVLFCLQHYQELIIDKSLVY